jgi:hypothetical protein
MEVVGSFCKAVNTLHDMALSLNSVRGCVASCFVNESFPGFAHSEVRIYNDLKDWHTVAKMLS